MREEGLYRIKLLSGNWTVAEWVENGASSGWFIPCCEEAIDDEQFEEIGEKIVFLCRWEDYPGKYISSCNHSFGTVDYDIEGPFDFCPFCGGKIVW